MSWSNAARHPGEHVQRDLVVTSDDAGCAGDPGGRPEIVEREEAHAERDGRGGAGPGGPGDGDGLGLLDRALDPLRRRIRLDQRLDDGFGAPRRDRRDQSRAVRGAQQGADDRPVLVQGQHGDRLEGSRPHPVQHGEDAGVAQRVGVEQRAGDAGERVGVGVRDDLHAPRIPAPGTAGEPFTGSRPVATPRVSRRARCGTGERSSPPRGSPPASRSRPRSRRCRRAAAGPPASAAR